MSISRHFETLALVDPYWRLKRDVNYRNEVNRIRHELNLITKEAPRITRELNGRIGELMQRLLRISNYNAGLLVPYFFPRYPKDVPLTLFRRPYAFPMMSLLSGGYICIRGSRQIAKSTTLVARQLIYSRVIPRRKSVYLTGMKAHTDQYVQRFREMEKAFIYKVNDTSLRQNLQLKEYSNGSVTHLLYAQTDDRYVRGKTADEILFDEYQVFDTDLEADIMMIATTNPGINKIYAGTALSTDSPLELKYQDSSRGVWMVRCGCGNYINFGDLDHSLRIIRPDRLRCDKCSRPIDPTLGEFVFEDHHALALNRLGVHIPQTIIADLVNDPDWYGANLVEAIRNFTPAKISQEILGIPTDQGSREITRKDLEAISMLGTPEEALEKAQRGYYKMVISGLDWGGSDYNPAAKTKKSYTAHVIMGMTYEGMFDILHFRRYADMDYIRIASEILEDHKKFRGSVIASDYGVGSAYNLLLRVSDYVRTENHFIFNYNSNLRGMASMPMKNSGLANLLILNRTDSLSEVFMSIKSNDRRPPRIRSLNWRYSEQYLMDLLNVWRAPMESNMGITGFKYIKPDNKTDDVLHAINFAFCAGRMLNREQILRDTAMEEHLAAMFRGTPDAWGRDTQQLVTNIAGEVSSEARTRSMWDLVSQMGAV